MAAWCWRIVAVLVFFLTRAGAGRPGGGAAGRPGHGRGHRARAEGRTAWTSRCRCSSCYGCASWRSGNLGQSIFLQRPVTQALLGARRADDACWRCWRWHRRADRRAVRHRLRGLARPARSTRCSPAFAMLGASVPELLVRPGADADLRGGARLVPGLGLWRAGASLAERLHHLVLPAIVLGVLNSALILRFTRASMLDVLGEDYVRTARAKGLPESARGAQARAAQCAGADRHRARPDGGADDRRRGRDRDGVRPARRRQPGGQRRAAARLSR